MALIEKRGDRQWRARVRKRGCPEVSRTFDYEADATAWSRSIEVEMQRGSFLPKSRATSTTFKELAKRYLVEVTPTKRSAPSERGRISVLIERFGPYFVGAITREMVGAFRDARLATPTLRADRLRKDKPVNPRSRRATVVDAPRTLSAQSVVHELNTLSVIIEHARREWGIHLPENPAHVSKPRTAGARTRRLSADELQWLLIAAAASSAPGLRQVIVLAVETSMRLGELLALQWVHVDLTCRTAHLPRSKNGESRTVALSTAAVAAFGELQAASVDRRPGDRVFHWAASDSFQKSWRRCVERAQALRAASIAETGAPTPAGFLEDLRFHDLRHEAISRLVEKGLSVFEVSSMSGHKSLAMLKRYTHVEAQRVAAKLA